MPTGYTGDIEKGITFPAFAMSCARAFGALITMRDEPSDAKIPDEFKPAPYYANAVKEAEAKLARLREMTVREAAEEQAKERAKLRVQAAREKKRQTKLLNRYNAMLAKVVQWEPPTEEHIGLKNFMAEQIRESIKFDCDYFTTMLQHLDVEPSQYCLQHIKKAEDSLAYAKKSAEEEVERCQSRSEWVRALRRSLRSRRTPR